MHAETWNLKRGELLTNIDINDGRFIFVKKQFPLKISTIDLTRDQSGNLQTLHSVHSCRLKD